MQLSPRLQSENLIKKTGVGEFQGEIAIISCFFNVIMSFQLFQKK